MVNVRWVQRRTSRRISRMSALPPKADISHATGKVRFCAARSKRDNQGEWTRRIIPSAEAIRGSASVAATPAARCRNRRNSHQEAATLAPGPSGKPHAVLNKFNAAFFQGIQHATTIASADDTPVPPQRRTKSRGARVSNGWFGPGGGTNALGTSMACGADRS
jgi:hypothetical protein